MIYFTPPELLLERGATMSALGRVIFCIPLLFVGFVSSGRGQDLPIDQIRKTVVYLQGDFLCREPDIVNGVQALAPDGTPLYKTKCSQVGTGFLILISTPELGPGVGIPLLVTSKHLIQHQSFGRVKGVVEYFDSITAVVNSIKPNSEGSYIASIPVTVKDNGFLVCSIDNKDPDADVAACPINIPDSVYDFKSLLTDMFVTPTKIQAMKLNETDEVLFSGLFLPYHGANKNYPIVRHGKLALIPKEKIPWSTPNGSNSMQDLYLADITSWGGNSGSPVFIRLSGALEQGGIISGVQYLLLGVMQGYFNSDRPASLDTAAITDTAHLNIELTDNSGIAAIVPADKIIDIVGQPRITAYISIIKANAYAKSGKLSEAESSFKDAIDMLRKNDPEHPLLREALREYAALLQNAGRFPEANFLLRQANQVNNTLHTPNDQLR
jgi:hypothetical protein